MSEQHRDGLSKLLGLHHENMTAKIDAQMMRLVGAPRRRVSCDCLHGWLYNAAGLLRPCPRCGDSVEFVLPAAGPVMIDGYPVD